MVARPIIPKVVEDFEKLDMGSTPYGDYRAAFVGKGIR